MERREFLMLLCACLATRVAVGASGPRLWLARRGQSRVFLFGFGDARDRSWLTPAIEGALDQSAELWLEVGPGRPPSEETAETRAAAERLRVELGQTPGRTFFDALEPHVRDRAAAYISELGIDRSAIEPLRPWLAYYTINGAFWAKRKQPYPTVNVDQVLQERALAANKRIGYELPSREAFARFMAAMPDQAQSQYIEWLLDFLDEHSNGLGEDSYRWIEGNPVVPSLDRMRTKQPALYQVMQVQRNAWWASKVDELLATPRTHFVGVGQLHVLGPDGIPVRLRERGIALELVAG